MTKDEVFTKIKDNQKLVTIGAFCLVALIAIIVGICACKVAVVPMCALIMIQAGMAVLLHNAELWVHGILGIAELIAGILCGQLVVVIICIIVYVAATYALKFYFDCQASL